MDGIDKLETEATEMKYADDLFKESVKNLETFYLDSRKNWLVVKGIAYEIKSDFTMKQIVTMQEGNNA
jgi:hypothetical protein